ncbi:GntR family transcriptional regulator [Actinacidiphila glaucinigra]|uniref:GntR family transcriptional regulator n=2 Tax=Streptomycetaceae TaxID=2062 RepID=UPI00386302DE
MDDPFKPLQLGGYARGVLGGTVSHVDPFSVGRHGAVDAAAGGFLLTAPCRGLLRSRGIAREPTVATMGSDLDRTRAVWKQVVALVVDRINDGTYPPGSRVPSTLELATELGIATSTSQKALAHLRNEGWLRGETGIGTFVADQPPTDD